MLTGLGGAGTPPQAPAQPAQPEEGGSIWGGLLGKLRPRAWPAAGQTVRGSTRLRRWQTALVSAVLGIQPSQAQTPPTGRWRRTCSRYAEGLWAEAGLLTLGG